MSELIRALTSLRLAFSLIAAVFVNDVVRLNAIGIASALE